MPLGPDPQVGHAQSAVNNFLGLHAHDSQYYIAMGPWVVDKETYAYGNTLMWTQTRDFIKERSGDAAKFWSRRALALAVTF